MKPTIVSLMSAIVLFVGTSPHAVGAMFIPTLPVLTEPSKEGGIVFLMPKDKAKQLAKERLREMYPNTWRKQWSALAKLWGKESAWNHTAQNPTSSAYGIAQVLKTPKGSTIEYQVRKGLEYIAHRYEKPTRAWEFHQRNRYY